MANSCATTLQKKKKTTYCCTNILASFSYKPKQLSDATKGVVCKYYLTITMKAYSFLVLNLWNFILTVYLSFVPVLFRNIAYLFHSIKIMCYYLHTMTSCHLKEFPDPVRFHFRGVFFFFPHHAPFS